MCTLREDLCTYVILSRSLLVRIAIFLTKFVQKIETQITR